MISPPEPAASRDPARVPYGWIIVGALSVTETVSWGIIYYGFPVFLQAMEREFKASAVSVAGAFSLALAITALAAVPVGRWIDRAGSRGLMTLGSCLAAALTLAWARTTSLGMLYAVWCGMGFAMAMTLYDPAFATIVQWFGRHRDRALLTVTLVAGLASAIFMPLAAWLLARVGWRDAVEILGVFLAVVTIPIHALVLRASSLTHAPHGGATGPPSTGVTLRNALRTSVFWTLNGAFAVGAFATVTITVHLIPFLTQRGYPQAYAAAAVGWIGAMQIPGRLLFVPIAAWLGPRAVTGSVFIAQAAAMAMLPFAGRLPALIPAILLLGAANGMATLARPSAVADAFGRRYYASVSGAIAVGSNGARALAPIGAALLGSWMGSYGSLFWTLSAALAAAGIVLFVTETRAVAAEVPRPAPRGTPGSPD
jgi:predicted MFS family arabinose efflux permease